MAISKDRKKKLFEQYVADLVAAENAVVVQQSGVSVTTATAVRKNIKIAQGKYVVVRKRLFLRALKEAGLQEIVMDDVPGSIVLVTTASGVDEFGPLKAVNKALKELKKKDEGSSYTFLGGWFDKVWKDGVYVNELANIPSKEELVSKLLFMLKYPMQSFVSVADQVAQKLGDGIEDKQPTEAVASPVSGEQEQPKEEVQEEVKEEVKEEVNDVDAQETTVSEADNQEPKGE